MRDNKEDGETAALVSLLPVIAIWTWSWQVEPQWTETSSVCRLTWKILCGTGGGRATRQLKGHKEGCRAQLLSHWGVKIGTVSVLVLILKCWIMNDRRQLRDALCLCNKGNGHLFHWWQQIIISDWALINMIAVKYNNFKTGTHPQTVHAM